MKYFPKLLTRDECVQFIQRVNNTIDEQSLGFWAAENLESGELMGCVGITRMTYETDFTPAVEIGWRLAYKFWGDGFATEAGQACLQFGFDDADLPEIVSFTSIHNLRSLRVMERLGMTRCGEFDHPKIPDGHHLKRHVLYRISRNEFFTGRELEQPSP